MAQIRLHAADTSLEGFFRDQVQARKGHVAIHLGIVHGKTKFYRLFVNLLEPGLLHKAAQVGNARVALQLDFYRLREIHAQRLAVADDPLGKRISLSGDALPAQAST